MKNLFSLFFFSLICSLGAYAYDVEVDGICYNLNPEEKTASVTYRAYHVSYDTIINITIPEQITVNGETYMVTSIGKESFYNCSALASVIIPESVTSLGDYCFSECEVLTSIKLPDSISRLGKGCFHYCSALTSINIPKSLTTLEDVSFAGCSSLSSVTIPELVTSIGGRCFSGCSSLTSISLPKSVTSLGYGCFSACSSMSSIIVLATTPPEANGLYHFLNTPLKTIYVVSEEAKALYQATSPWKRYEIVVMQAGIDGLKVEQDASVIGYYDLGGRRLNDKQHGIVIERYADGTSRKVMVK